MADSDHEAQARAERQSYDKLASTGKKRTRTGCLNCRRKRRKCDEVKPTCEGCQSRKETCEWGLKVSFRPENAQSVGADHPSMIEAAACGRGQNYQIVDITQEVIRDFHEGPIDDDFDDIRWRRPSTVIASGNSTVEQSAVEGPFHLPGTSSPTPLQLDLATETPLRSHAVLFLSPQTSDSASEDGVFLPGSQYQELHAALRSRIIDTARSTVPSRLASPELSDSIAPLQDSNSDESADEASRRLAELTAEDEHLLWQNYLDEVASWLDKFDMNRHFELVLPVLAKSHPHLRYSLLAISARQIELKSKSMDNSCSLALYQHAIHILSPLLQQRTTIVLASCVVLCVLEMLSCSPKAWRRHLDGCAALIQALGLTGCCGGLEQAIFWCFARMDICGGLISSEKTLIPMDRWMAGGDLLLDYALLQAAGDTFDMYANRMVYLCGQVTDLLCTSGKWEQKRSQSFPSMGPNEYMQHWSQLFELVERWFRDRPEEMKPLFTIASPDRDNKPFHTLFFGNEPATSGNQMYHTAALLMLKFKPSGVQFAAKPRSILWHARQICAIGMSNRYHSCWTNGVQPLWIAGQHMSHPSEHRAILDLYERIERETGWATKWRADDLREYWGELDD